MTNKTTINKIVSSKAFWIIISLLASFLLWTYIMSTEETTIEMTFSNVKVVYQGADDLRATRGLIVTGADADTVSVRLKGTRRVLGNLSSAMEIPPVSSDTITITASECSLMPMPARWRVPRSGLRFVLLVSGRTQPAAAMRPSRITTAPSCSGALG